jgi:hypothetical protein
MILFIQGFLSAFVVSAFFGCVLGAFGLVTFHNDGNGDR